MVWRSRTSDWKNWLTKWFLLKWRIALGKKDGLYAHPKEVIITVGVSASGKSTWAREHINRMKEERDGGKHYVRNWCIVERDKIRATILNKKTSGKSGGQLIWADWKFRWEDEVTEVQEEMFADAIKRGDSVVVSDTNLNRKHRDKISEIFRDAGYQVSYRYFPIQYETAVKRDAARLNGVGSFVIAKQFVSWDEQFEKKYRPDPQLPKSVIVDLDGTLAKMSSRSPFDWHRVKEDTVHEHVRDVVRGLHLCGYYVIIVSGRDGCCEQLSREWLIEHEIPFDAFFMRKEGDMRKDTIVKEEILFKEIEMRYNVTMAIDDRPSVCRTWERLGIPVLKCGNQQVFF